MSLFVHHQVVIVGGGTAGICFPFSTGTAC